MSEPDKAITPLEQYLVSAWAGDKQATLDALLGAAGYALSLGRADDAEDMCFCAKLAFAIAYDNYEFLSNTADDAADAARERMREAAWEIEAT